MATTLANNGQIQFSATGINSYTTFGGNVIEFTPEHCADKWGIVSMTTQSISSDMSQWHLAKGDIIDADGKGCIIIKNPILGQALVMDLRTNSNNVINPTIVQASLFPGISCDTVKP